MIAGGPFTARFPHFHTIFQQLPSMAHAPDAVFLPLGSRAPTGPPGSPMDRWQDLALVARVPAESGRENLDRDGRCRRGANGLVKSRKGHTGLRPEVRIACLTDRSGVLPGGAPWLAVDCRLA